MGTARWRFGEVRDAIARSAVAARLDGCLLRITPERPGPSRLVVVVARRFVASSVTRHRIQRRFRAAFRAVVAIRPEIGYDHIVFVRKQQVADIPFDALKGIFTRGATIRPLSR